MGALWRWGLHAIFQRTLPIVETYTQFANWLSPNLSRLSRRSGLPFTADLYASSETDSSDPNS